MSDWKKMLGTVAPWIGAAATGGVPALVGMAAAQVGQAFGSDVKPTLDAIGQAISGATPDQMLALKQADNEFAVKMKELGFQNEQALLQIAADDRASARAMHTAVRDFSTPILSFAVTAAFFLTLYIVLTKSLNIDPSMRDVVMIMIGNLCSTFTQVMNFRFGTSVGSKDKTEIIKGLSK